MRKSYIKIRKKEYKKLTENERERRKKREIDSG